MDPSFVINGKNRIERGFQDGAFARLAFAQRIFRPFSFGDVARNLGSADYPAARILKRRYAQSDIDSGAIFPQPSRFIMLDPLAVFEFFENFRLLALQFRRDQQTDRTAYDLFGRVTEDSHRSRVPAQNGAFQRLADNRVAGRFHDRRELVARCFRPFALANLAHVTCKHRRAVALNAGDGQFDRKFPAICVHRSHFNALAQHQGLAGGQKARQTLAMFPSQRARDDQVAHLAAEHLRAAIAKRLLRCWIPLDHFAFVVDGNDAIQSRFQSGALERFTFPQ